jgi:hypothetical protein
LEAKVLLWKNRRRWNGIYACGGYVIEKACLGDIKNRYRMCGGLYPGIDFDISCKRYQELMFG